MPSAHGELVLVSFASLTSGELEGPGSAGVVVSSAGSSVSACPLTSFTALVT